MLIENQLKKLGFGTAAVFLLIVAVLLGAASMYLMAVVLALVPLAGWLFNRIMAFGLVCRRNTPETADEHGRILVSVTLENRGFLPKFYLRVFDGLPRFMRFAGTPPDDPAFITRLWPGESARVRYYIEPLKRGAHRIGPLIVQSTDLFGFSELRTRSNQYAEVLVYPETLPVNPKLMSSGLSSGWQDEQNARSRGNGTDFVGVREYRPGDEQRRINWKTTARTGALAVTEFTQGYTGDIVIVLDCEAAAYENSGSGQISAFEYGVKIAASLGAAALRQGSRIQFCAAGIGGDQDMVELQGDGELPRLLDYLARVEPDRNLSLSRQLERNAAKINPGSVALIVTGRDTDDPNLRNALETWRKPPVSAGLNVFWLDRASFSRAHEEWRSGRFVSTQIHTGGLAQSVRTDFGMEHFVSADTNLPALLGGSLVA